MIYAILYKPTGELCELGRDKNGALTCYMTYQNEAAALAALADLTNGADDFEVMPLPAGIRHLEFSAYQDGGRFFSSRTDKLLANYSHLVRNDYDIPMAEAARKLFLSNFSQYTLEA